MKTNIKAFGILVLLVLMSGIGCDDSGYVPEVVVIVTPDAGTDATPPMACDLSKISEHAIELTCLEGVTAAHFEAASNFCRMLSGNCTCTHSFSEELCMAARCARVCGEQ